MATKKMELGEILEKNPQINEEQLRIYRELLVSFRKIRTYKKRYDLASPADLVRIVLSDDNVTDARTTDLSCLNTR